MNQEEKGREGKRPHQTRSRNPPLEEHWSGLTLQAWEERFSRKKRVREGLDPRGASARERGECPNPTARDTTSESAHGKKKGRKKQEKKGSLALRRSTSESASFLSEKPAVNIEREERSNKTSTSLSGSGSTPGVPAIPALSQTFPSMKQKLTQFAAGVRRGGPTKKTNPL